MPPRGQVTLINGTPSINPRVPMFLQKLYKIVSDPSTNDVICWSDSGDSFFVHDHERLAKEHLGNWFKHNKFASFVRQLNMYGFHKIPHLQQGVLRSDSDAEHSQFAHPDFHRGQEDRLIFIERKKQAVSNQRDQGVVDFPNSNAQTATQPQPTLSSGQALDIHSIVSGIAAIRRHQASISSELSELKRSNQMLWQESMEARSRHQKQQDTINRIVKFLAGVFGHHTASPGPREKDGSPSAHHSVVPMQNTRLMIEDSQRDTPGKVGIVEVQDEENMTPMSRDLTPRPFASIGTPLSTVSRSLSQPPSDEPLSPVISDISPPSSHTARPETHSPSLEYSPLLSTDPPPTDNSSSVVNSIISTQPRHPGLNLTHGSANGLPTLSPSRSPALDERFQAALNQLSASDIQQLFASLAAQPINSDAIDENPAGQQQPNSQMMTPYKTPFDFGPLSPPIVSPQSPPSPLSGPDGLISFDSSYPIEQNWKQAEDIEKEVNAMNSGIDSLIETLGLDPALLQQTAMDTESDGLDPAAVLDTSSLPSGGIQASGSEEFFNSFLGNLQSNDVSASSGLASGHSDPSVGINKGFDNVVDYSVIEPTASYENASTPTTSSASPSTIHPQTPIPESQTPNNADPPISSRAGARKRKSDTDFLVKQQVPVNPKAKRRKDK